MSLMGSLGLDNVEADPNALPAGKYAGVVFKADFVVAPAKNTYNLVLTYKVTEGERNGAQRQEWFTLGTVTSKDDAGNVTAINPTMKETQKPWFKKRLVDLGIPENQIPALDQNSVQVLVGKPIFFGVRHNDGYINISFVEARDTVASPVMGQVPGGPLSGML